MEGRYLENKNRSWINIRKLLEACEASGPVWSWISQAFSDSTYGLLLPLCSTSDEARNTIDQTCAHPKDSNLSHYTHQHWRCSLKWSGDHTRPPKLNQSSRPNLAFCRKRVKNLKPTMTMHTAGIAVPIDNTCSASLYLNVNML